MNFHNLQFQVKYDIENGMFYDVSVSQNTWTKSNRSVGVFLCAAWKEIIPLQRDDTQSKKCYNFARQKKNHLKRKCLQFSIMPRDSFRN